MEMALSEITLVLFTTIAPAGIVGYVVVALYGLLATGERATRASRYLVVPLVLVISGLIASATHLGTPANALYVLTGFGRSPLSNEVVVVVGFLALGGMYWMLSFRDDLPRGAQVAALGVASVAGLAAIGAISGAYSVWTVPTWSVVTAPATLWLGAVAPGVVTGLFALMVAKVPLGRRFAGALLAAGAAASVADGVVLGLQWQLLGTIQTTVQSAQALVPLLPVAAVAFPLVALACLAVVAIVFWRSMAPSARLLADSGARGAATAAAWPLSARAVVFGSGLVLLAACFAVRFSFYAMYMTAGV